MQGAATTCRTCALLVYTLTYSNQVDMFLKVLVCDENGHLQVDSMADCLTQPLYTFVLAAFIVIAAVVPLLIGAYIYRNRDSITQDPVFYERSSLRGLFKSYR